MIDLKQAYNEGLNNIRAWRNRYTAQEYPHKIVINMMYRAYSMEFLWQDYINGVLPCYENFQDAVIAMEQKYSQSAIENVRDNLLEWIERKPNQAVGNIEFSKYDKSASIAESNKGAKEELEFSYVFDLLQQKCVLYWIALRQIGYSDVDAISAITDVVIESIPNMDYAMAKYVFQELCVKQYMGQNYLSLP